MGTPFQICCLLDFCWTQILVHGYWEVRPGGGNCLAWHYGDVTKRGTGLKLHDITPTQPGNHPAGRSHDTKWWHGLKGCAAVCVFQTPPRLAQMGDAKTQLDGKVVRAVVSSLMRTCPNRTYLIVHLAWSPGHTWPHTSCLGTRPWLLNTFHHGFFLINVHLP